MANSMQMLVPSYLEFSIERLASDSQKFREQFDAAMSANPLANPLANPTRQMFQTMEEQARKNMAMFREALDMFSPFSAQRRRDRQALGSGRIKRDARAVGGNAKSGSTV